MISPAIIRRRVTEKTIKKSPDMPPVKSSLPFFTCSGLAPPVMIMTVATSITMRANSPTVPARNPRREEVKPLVSYGMQPRAVLTPPEQPISGSTFSTPELLITTALLRLEPELAFSAVHSAALPQQNLLLLPFLVILHE